MKTIKTTKPKAERLQPNDLDKSIAKALDGINGNMNFAGFTKRFVNSIVAQAELGLTAKQQNMAVLILCKYRRQIPNYAILLSQLSPELKTVAAEYLKGKK
jgi:hypothetical protein